MSVTTSGTYRVLASPRRDEEWLLLDIESADPTYVPTPSDRPAGDGNGANEPDALEAGNRIEATIEWDEGGNPRVGTYRVLSRTRITAVDGATGIFEAARETAREAKSEGIAMNSRVTKDTDGVENGVVYTFAKQAGQRDLYEEFRDGLTPLEPFFERLLDGGADPPFDAFVIRPAEESFVLVCIALERDGLLARTMRDTYVEA